MFLFCLVFAMSLCASVYMCFVITCWKRADLLALVCGVYCEFVTFPLVSWVRCGTWLYRFLIFAPLLTLSEALKTGFVATRPIISIAWLTGAPFFTAWHETAPVTISLTSSCHIPSKVEPKITGISCNTPYSCVWCTDASSTRRV